MRVWSIFDKTPVASLHIIRFPVQDNMAGQFQEPEEATMWTRKEINVFKETIRFYLEEKVSKTIL